MSTLNRPTQITDDRGRFPNHAYDREPEPASVVLTEGEFGTMWQRFFSDGKWHAVRGGRALTWEEMLNKRNMVLIYDAPFREQKGSKR